MWRVFCFGKSELKTLLEYTLSKNEKLILAELTQLEGLTLSGVVKDLYSGYPPSTVKSVLKRLKKMDLIVCGDNGNRGIPVSFTKFGKKLVDLLGVSSNGRIMVSKNLFLLKKKDLHEKENISKHKTEKTVDGRSNRSAPTRTFQKSSIKTMEAMTAPFPFQKKRVQMIKRKLMIERRSSNVKLRGVI